MTDTDSAPRGKRLVQCPGCWATGVLPSDVQHECDHCGEAMTVVDLREARATRSPDAPHDNHDGCNPYDEAHISGKSGRAASPSVTLDELRPFLIHAVDTAIVNALIEYARLTKGTDR